MSMGKSKSSSQQGVWGAQQPFLQDLYRQAQNYLPQAQQQMGGLQGQMGQALTGFINPTGNPYLDQMAQAGLGRLNQNYQQNILPAIGSAGVQAGNLGSSRHGVAQGLAAQQQQQASQDYLTNLYGQQYQQDMNRALGATAMLPQLGQMGWQPLQQYAHLIGRPTTLGQSQGSSKSLGLGGLI